MKSHIRLRSCWDDDPKIRPTFDSILNFFLPRILPQLTPEINEKEYKNQGSM